MQANHVRSKRERLQDRVSYINRRCVDPFALTFAGRLIGLWAIWLQTGRQSSNATVVPVAAARLESNFYSLRNKFPWMYLLLAYVLAWVFWIPVALTGRDYQSSPWLILLLLLGVFGPGLSAIILTYRGEGKRGGREFWRRVFDFRRIRSEWYALILLFWPGLCLLALAVHLLFGGSLPVSELLQQIISQPTGFLVIPILYVIQAGLEELGWRGYMLDRLQEIWRPLGASLVLGGFHAIWHLPLFWIVGTDQIAFGFGLDFWIFIGMVIAGSIYSTWCYNSNQRSTLAVILLHATSNLSVGLFTGPGAERRLYFLLVIAGAVVIALIWGLQTSSFAQRKRKEIYL